MNGVDAVRVLVQIDDLIPRGSRVNVFDSIYWVFLTLGTVVGIIVVGYMLYNAFRYRAVGDHATEGDDDRPTLGELPTGGGKGRKLFISFFLSAVVVISLIVWTYGTLLFVEQPASAQEAEEELEIEVVGRQFMWEFTYPNGHTSNELRVPADTRVRLVITSEDVFHNFGIPALRAKADAIPGQTTDTWFVAERPGEYQAHCYELCGNGHSAMKADVIVMEQAAFEEWYANTSGSGGGNASEGNASEGNASDGNASNGNASDGNASNGNASDGNASSGTATDGTATDGNAGGGAETTAAGNGTATAARSATATADEGVNAS